MCIRDEQGRRFVKANVKQFEGTPDIMEAEAMGLLVGLTW
jgi:hypothetical protein